MAILLDETCMQCISYFQRSSFRNHFKVAVQCSVLMSVCLLRYTVLFSKDDKGSSIFGGNRCCCERMKAQRMHLYHNKERLRHRFGRDLINGSQLLEVSL